MEWVLGIDQGGTKTLAAISALDGTILGLGWADGAQHSVTGMEYAMRQASLATKNAAESAGIPLGPFSAIAAGMSGADFDYEYELLKNALAAEFSCEKVRVVNDCIIALRGGTWEPDAAVICAGTGLNCAVLTGNGDEFVFGYYIDDQWQGGGAIAEKALMTVFEAHVGLRNKTVLTKKILDHFQETSVESLLQRKVRRELDTAKINRLAEAVDQCAADGDGESIRILEEFGRACANYAIAGLSRFHLLNQPVTVVLSGSIFKSKGLLPRSVVEQEIHCAAPLAKITDARYEPVVGGIILALEEAGAAPINLGKIEASAARCGAIRQTNHLERSEGDL